MEGPKFTLARIAKVPGHLGDEAALLALRLSLYRGIVSLDAQVG